MFRAGVGRSALGTQTLRSFCLLKADNVSRHFQRSVGAAQNAPGAVGRVQKAENPSVFGLTPAAHSGAGPAYPMQQGDSHMGRELRPGGQSRKVNLSVLDITLDQGLLVVDLFDIFPVETLFLYTFIHDRPFRGLLFIPAGSRSDLHHQRGLRIYAAVDALSGTLQVSLEVAGVKDAKGQSRQLVALANS